MSGGKEKPEHIGDLQDAAFRQILDSLPDEIAVIDSRFRVLYLNKAKQRTVGPFAQGLTCYSTFEKSMGPCPHCAVRAAFRRNQAIHTLSCSGRDGRESTISVTAFPLLNGSGETVAAVELVRNVTVDVKVQSLRLVLGAATTRDEIVGHTIQTVSEYVSARGVALFKWDSSAKKLLSMVLDRFPWSRPESLAGEFRIRPPSLNRAFSSAASWVPKSSLPSRSWRASCAILAARGALTVHIAPTSGHAYLGLIFVPSPPIEADLNLATRCVQLASSAIAQVDTKKPSGYAHQDRPFLCPISGEQCASDVQIDPTSVFVGTGYSPDDENLFRYGIQPALAVSGRQPRRPNARQSCDLCTVCGHIRCSAASIVDVSAWSGNALFELGMIYGLGRQAILLRKRRGTTPVDLQGIEYLPYDDYFALQQDLQQRLPLLSESSSWANLSDRCFKFGAQCQYSHHVRADAFFVGMPFRPEFENVYKAAIRPALESLHLHSWKADEEPRIIDIMCKVCQGIQSSHGAVINLTTWNPNVLFELGLITALGKPVFLLREAKDKTMGDLRNLRYTRYSDFGKLRRKLEKWLQHEIAADK